jgi:hypothetical protein
VEEVPRLPQREDEKAKRQEESRVLTFGGGVPTLDGMDYERLFAVVLSASLAANALTFAFIWAMRWLTSHEERGRAAKDAPFFVLIVLALVPLAMAAGVFAIGGQ